MSNRLEREDESDFVEWCRAQGISCLKLRLASESSWPDRTLLSWGFAAFFELKKKGERPTPLQQYTLDRLVADGFPADWADNLEDAKKFVNNWIQHVNNLRSAVAQIRPFDSSNG